MHRKIIKDLDALRENYQPLDIGGRKEKIKKLFLSLKPASFGQIQNSIISGKPGTGKTTIAKHVLGKLKEEANLSGAYVSLWENKTLYSVLSLLVEKEKIFFAEARDTKVKLAKFREHISGGAYLLVLDDIDIISPKQREDILWAFLRMDKVGVICTCQNIESLLFSLDERIRSRLLASKVNLKPYQKEEILDILKQRARLALTEESYDETVLNLIAKEASGDGRCAIQTLRMASEIAEDGGGKIRLKHVKEAKEKASKLKKKSFLSELTEDHRIIYRIIETRRGILSSDLWKIYLKKCKVKRKKPIARRTFTKYIRKLKTLSLIETKRASVRGRVRKFFVNTEG